MDFYHAGMRELQDRFEGRAVPDRLAENRMRTKFNEADRQFIESSPFFSWLRRPDKRRLFIQRRRTRICSVSR
jgi:hypothetical protein